MSYSDSVTLHNYAAGTADRYGNATQGADTTMDSPAWVGGQTSTETARDGDKVIQRLACHVPPDVTVTAATRVTWRGDNYEIDGEPLPMSRRGVLHHYELTLKRVEG